VLVLGVEAAARIRRDRKDFAPFESERPLRDGEEELGGGGHQAEAVPGVSGSPRVFEVQGPVDRQRDALSEWFSGRRLRERDVHGGLDRRGRMGEPIGPSRESRVIVVDGIHSTMEYPRGDTHAPDPSCDKSGERNGALRPRRHSRAIPADVGRRARSGNANASLYVGRSSRGIGSLGDSAKCCYLADRDPCVNEQPPGSPSPTRQGRMTDLSERLSSEVS
jgi:hypothetical protein